MTRRAQGRSIVSTAALAAGLAPFLLSGCAAFPGDRDGGWKAIPVAWTVTSDPAGETHLRAGQTLTVGNMVGTEVGGRWLRFSALVAEPSAELTLLVTAGGDGSPLIRRSLASSCPMPGERRRCGVSAWIPADATHIELRIWTPTKNAVTTGFVTEVGRPVAWRDGDRIAIDSMLATLEADFYRTAEVDWPSLRRGIHAIPAPPPDTDPLPLIARQAIRLLPGNEHMRVVPNASMTTDDATLTMPGCRTDNGVGVLTLPGIGAVAGDGPARFAAVLNDCLMGAPADRTWVVDLRGNDGGNMIPMIRGIAPLLPEGDLYTFVDGRKRVTRIGVDPRGVTSDGAPVETGAAADVGERVRAPVVVLYGPACASSCEQTANALAARARTLFVGEPTGGFSTANRIYRLNEAYSLLITTGYTTDPCGRVIDDRLVPDVTIDHIDRRTVAEVLADTRVAAWIASTRQLVDQPVRDDERDSRCVALRSPGP